MVLWFLNKISSTFNPFYTGLGVSSNSNLFQDVDNFLGISYEHITFQMNIVDDLYIPFSHVIRACGIFTDDLSQSNTTAIIVKKEVVLDTIIPLCPLVM